MTEELLAPKDKAPGSPQTVRFTGQEIQQPDSATSSAREPVPLSKEAASLQAEFALAGFELQPLPDGSFVVGRWGLVRALNSFDDAIRFAKQAGLRDG